MLKTTFVFRGSRFYVREYGQGYAYDIEDSLTGEGAHLVEDDAAIFADRLHGLAARFPSMALDALIHRCVEGAPMEYRI